MINNKNIYINPDPISATLLYDGDFFYKGEVFSFTLAVEDDHPTLVTWTDDIPEVWKEAEELIKIKFGV